MPVPKQPQRPISLKSFDQDGPGSFTGLLSPYDVVDQVNDCVCKGAFTKTITDNGGSVPILWQHDETEPIGTMYLEDSPSGLMVKGQLLLDDSVPYAKKAYALVKSGTISGLSIGFTTVKADPRNSDGVRNIREAKLWEGSVVTFPAATQAQVYAVKSRGDGIGDFDEQLDAAQTACAGYQILSTLCDSLYSVWWNAGYDPDGDLAMDMPALISYAEANFDQAKEAYLGALAKYGNMSAEGDPDEMKMIRTKAKAKFLELKIRSAVDIEAKATLTKRVAGEDLPASAFLIVGDSTKTETWKLPVKFSTDAKTKSHIRNALARINQVTGVSSEDLSKAKKKLEAMAKEYGIDAATASKAGEGAGETAENAAATAVVTPQNLETKKGKTISAETAAALRTAHEHMKSAGGILGALYGDDPSETSEDVDSTAADSESGEPSEKSHSSEIREALALLSQLVEQGKPTAAATQ